MTIIERSAAYAGWRTRELFVDGAGPTVVLLHGFGHPSRCWTAVLEGLQDRGCRAVAIDLPGFGNADELAPSHPFADLIDFARDVVRTHADSEPVIVVGNSLGASLGVQMTGDDPTLPVAGLVALDAGGDRWTLLGRVIQLGNGFGLRLLTSAASHRMGRRCRDTVAASLLYGDRTAADPDMVALLTDPIADRATRKILLQLGLAFVADVAGTATPRAITCPTTVVHGTRDRIVPIAASRRLHHSIPDSTLVLLEGIGHCPQLDAPARVVDLILGTRKRAGYPCPTDETRTK